jgi:hypothetical protein
MSEGLVGGEGFAIDASVVRADASPMNPRRLDRFGGFTKSSASRNRGLANHEK